MEQAKALRMMLDNIEFLKGHKLVAVIPVGSRMYNLNTPDSDYDFKVIYVPTRVEMYTNDLKQSRAFKFEQDGYQVEVNTQDVRFYINQLRKASVNALETLFYSGDYVPKGFEDYFDMEVYHNVFDKLIRNKRLVEQNNPMGVYDSIAGQMLQRKQTLLKHGNYEKDFVHYLRYVNLITDWNGHLNPNYLIEPKADDSYMRKLRLGQLTIDKDEALAYVNKHLELVKKEEFKSKFRIKNNEAKEFLAEMDSELMDMLLINREF